MSEIMGDARQHEKYNTVYTVTANCQDCYRCVRVCPVKAISVRDGQACIEDDLCIKCGTCVRECPQHAKTIRSSLYAVKRTAGLRPDRRGQRRAVIRRRV